MTVISFNQFKVTVKKENSRDTYAMSFFYRPIALRICWLLSNMSISANTLSAGNIFLLFLLAFTVEVFHVSIHVVMIALLSSSILDNMDGIVARHNFVTKQKVSTNGDAIDAASGYVFNIIFWLIVYVEVEKFGQVNTLGAVVMLTGALSILPRLIIKKSQAVNAAILNHNQSRLRYIDQELSFTGFMLPVFYACSLFGYLQIFTIFYFIIYSGQLLHSLHSIFFFQDKKSAR